MMSPERDNYRFLVLREEVGDGLDEYVKRHIHRLMMTVVCVMPSGCMMVVVVMGGVVVMVVTAVIKPLVHIGGSVNFFGL